MAFCDIRLFLKLKIPLKIDRLETIEKIKNKFHGQHDFKRRTAKNISIHRIGLAMSSLDSQ